MRSSMARRTTGKLGWGGGPSILFSASLVRGNGLQVGVGGPGHQGVMMKTLPG